MNIIEEVKSDCINGNNITTGYKKMLIAYNYFVV